MMRKSSGNPEKFYINNNCLCVNGEKITLLKIPSQQNKCYGGRNIKIEQEPVEEIEEFERKIIPKHVRNCLKPNITDYKNLEVCNKQLKQIYETVEIEDFERILRNFHVCAHFRKHEKLQEDRILKEINPTEIYEEFFDKHYKYLKNVVNAKT